MLAVVFGLTALAAAQAQVEPSQVEACKPTGAIVTAGPRSRPEPRRLGELPPAVHMRTVLRRIGDCNVAEVVRYDPVTREPRVSYEPLGPDRRREAVPRPPPLP